MIFKNSKILVADNTGPKKAKCLNIKKKKIGFLSDILVIAIKKKKKRKKKLKKNILHSIFITSKKKKKREDGSFISFKKNKIAILDDKLVFLGTNLKSLICKEIKKKKKKNIKLISYSRGNI
jgi:large subunit ribosomal protein L14